MAKRKRKLKKGIFIFFVFLICVAIYILFVYFIEGFNIKNIYIYDNKYLTDQEIIELAKLENYPNYYTLNTSSLEKKIKENPLIKDVLVRKKFFKQVHIKIDEYEILFKKQEDNKFVLENKKEIDIKDDVIDVPILINYVPNTKYDSFVSKFSSIKKEVMDKISEIKYDPAELDEDRFLLYMNDENYVYITLTKLDVLNKYNEAIEQFEGKKGILYLDSGNYFKIMD